MIGILSCVIGPKAGMHFSSIGQVPYSQASSVVRKPPQVRGATYASLYCLERDAKQNLEQLQTLLSLMSICTSAFCHCERT